MCSTPSVKEVAERMPSLPSVLGCPGGVSRGDDGFAKQPVSGEDARKVHVLRQLVEQRFVGNDRRRTAATDERYFYTNESAGGLERLRVGWRAPLRVDEHGGRLQQVLGEQLLRRLRVGKLDERRDLCRRHRDDRRRSVFGNVPVRIALASGVREQQGGPQAHRHSECERAKTRHGGAVVTTSASCRRRCR